MIGFAGEFGDGGELPNGSAGLAYDSDPLCPGCGVAYFEIAANPSLHPDTLKACAARKRDPHSGGGVVPILLADGKSVLMRGAA